MVVRLRPHAHNVRLLILKPIQLSSLVRITRHEHSLEMMQPTWLLPVVTFVVASSSGGVLAAPLQECSPSHALITIVVSMFMVSIGLSLSLMLLTVYILRLMIYGYPRGATIMSAFVPLGPTGQAGYSILLIGNNIKSVLPMTYNQSETLNLNRTGDTIQVLCLCISLVLWSLATMWLCFSLLGIQEVVRESRFPFTLSFWGIVFPNGLLFFHHYSIFQRPNFCRQVFMPITVSSSLLYSTHNFFAYLGHSIPSLR